MCHGALINNASLAVSGRENDMSGAEGPLFSVPQSNSKLTPCSALGLSSLLGLYCYSVPASPYGNHELDETSSLALKNLVF